MNLKQQRESLKERRKEKRDKKSQEILDDIIELEGARVKMSRMSSAELMEQKEYQKNLLKVIKINCFSSIIPCYDCNINICWRDFTA
jgi:hypothetical protein